MTPLAARAYDDQFPDVPPQRKEARASPPPLAKSDSLGGKSPSSQRWGGLEPHPPPQVDLPWPARRLENASASLSPAVPRCRPTQSCRERRPEPHRLMLRERKYRHARTDRCFQNGRHANRPPPRLLALEFHCPIDKSSA